MFTSCFSLREENKRTAQWERYKMQDTKQQQWRLIGARLSGDASISASFLNGQQRVIVVVSATVQVVCCGYYIYYRYSVTALTAY